MTPRQRWKVWYRQLRIIRRETAKAYLDMLLYGTGAVFITNEPDYVKYVPIQDVVIKCPTTST